MGTSAKVFGEDENARWARKSHLHLYPCKKSSVLLAKLTSPSNLPWEFDRGMKRLATSCLVRIFTGEITIQWLDWFVLLLLINSIAIYLPLSTVRTTGVRSMEQGTILHFAMKKAGRVELPPGFFFQTTSKLYGPLQREVTFISKKAPSIMR